MHVCLYISFDFKTNCKLLIAKTRDRQSQFAYRANLKPSVYLGHSVR